MGRRTSKDIAAKNLEAYPDVAADILNAFLHGGKKVIREEDLVPAPTETLYEADGAEHSQYEDLASYEYAGGKLNMIYLLANQSTVDYRMLLRKAGYVGGYYRAQYDKKIREVCPVTEQILYWGEKKWDAATSLRNMFRRRRTPDSVWEYVDDMRLHVWEMRRLPEEVRRRFTSDMRIVADYLAEGDGYASGRKVVHIKAVLDMLKSLSGEKNLMDAEKFMEMMGIREEDEISMGDLFGQYIRQGRREGLEEGRKEGIKEGKAEGRLEGRKEGKLETIRNFMRELHLTAEEALKIADVPQSEWEQYMEGLS